MAKSCKGLAEELVKCLSESMCVKVNTSETHMEILIFPLLSLSLVYSQLVVKLPLGFIPFLFLNFLDNVWCRRRNGQLGTARVRKAHVYRVNVLAYGKPTSIVKEDRYVLFSPHL